MRNRCRRCDVSVTNLYLGTENELSDWPICLLALPLIPLSQMHKIVNYGNRSRIRMLKGNLDPLATSHASGSDYTFISVACVHAN